MNTPQSHRGTEPEALNALTEAIIGCAIGVHRVLGPGLLEQLYESAPCIEFDEIGLRYERKRSVPVQYKGHLLGVYRIDLIVEDLVIVEVKSVERPVPAFEAQLITYLRVTKKRVGLLINFNSRLLKDGITRRAL